MAASDIKDLERHVRHDVVCVSYGEGENVAIECETCGEVLVDYDDEPEVQEEYHLLLAHVGHAVEVVRKHDRTAVECSRDGDELLIFTIENEAVG